MISRSFQHKVVYYLRHLPVLQKLLTWIYRKFFREGLEARRINAFRKNALSILKEFHNCLEENNYFYTLAFGSMLGAVREKGFIKHDPDIDVYMWIEDRDEKFLSILEKHGFTLSHSFSIENRKWGYEETFEKDDVSIDIFYVYPPINKMPYCCDFLTQPGCRNLEISMKEFGGVLPRRIEMPLIKKRVKTDFEDTQLYIPENAHDLLVYRYGENYMTPIKNWTIQSYDNHIVEWPDKLGIFQNF